MDKERVSKVKSCISNIVFNIEKIASKHAIYLSNRRKVESMYAGDMLIAERNKVINEYCNELNVARALITENLNKIEECLEEEDYVDISSTIFNSAVNILSNAKDLTPETADSIVKNFAGRNKELEIMGGLINPAYEPIVEGYKYNYNRKFIEMRQIVDMLSVNYDSPYGITNIRTELRKLATVFGIEWEDNESSDYYDFKMRNIATLINLDWDEVKNKY